jgi:hypothetical protein
MNRPLYVYKDAGKWWWQCILCNWESPQPGMSQAVAFHRAEMHYEITHTGPFNRSTRWSAA